MGQEYSVPKPNTKFQVIGAGLPRTGTASFSAALEILLAGPVYHGGTQLTLGPEYEVKTWLRAASLWPPSNDSARDEIKALIASRLDGFVATTDCPGTMYIPELVDLYPDAKVICTVRDEESWEKSMAVVSTAATKWFMRALFLPMPSLRYFPAYIDTLRDIWVALYGETEPVSKLTYQRHMRWLKEVVPKDRLVFFDVRDGWGPLCEALGVDVPDVPFPRVNDGEAIEKFAGKQFGRALKRWLLLLGGAGLLAYGVSWVMR
ncbi:NAD dependent epimerase/dehydratase [Pochonia chlamydosporia 170]|uniref:NAD dependent epimerase/dehydratase n=1 Tax=Pochonia chlamydosporia 170 TaxID=1380566 RepID=A0A179FIW0_METCM|nr:NAD dependent epimerase/dehydratase [Pochonia chlamydosporia 170]OAQ65191.1 NAD dependent epimerase/dehydratase [Pochonia chlamydosporia 170]